MKKLLIYCLCCTLFAATGYAQGRGRGHHKHHKGHNYHHQRSGGHHGHYVKVRPAPPRYAPLRSPGSGYVYIQDDWRWNPAINNWEWYGNRWVRAPRPAQVWRPGVWIQVSGGGWSWQAGGWR